MKPIRLAIIGCGGFVRSHVKAIVEGVPEFRIVALVDTAKAHALRLKSQMLPRKRPVIYTDHVRMLGEKAPDAVIVSTPHTLHFRHCMDAISAGAHVMVEKPMVTSSADARRLLANAERCGRIVQIAIQGVYTNTFAYARKLIADGTMGELQLVTGMLAQGWLEATRGTWRQDPKLSGGGQLYDSGAHIFSTIIFLVDSPVTEVFCWTDNKDIRVDVNAVAAIRFANGCMGSITSGGNCDTFYTHLIFQGAKAVMEISPHGGNFSLRGATLARQIKSVPAGWDIPSVTPARNFADAILGRAEPRCPGRLGLILAELMDALYKSARLGRPVRLRRKRR
ncbi:MAG: Gfo/Idh/MocA family protein [Planctomycetota bacterium]|jgi:predicted dehydrogenase